MTNELLNKDILLSNGIEVKNIVAKLDLGLELELSYLAAQFSHTSYEPERYPSLIFRPEGLPTILITNSGTLLFTGGESTESIYDAYHTIIEEFDSIGLDISGEENRIEIQNVVSTFELNDTLDLNRISILLGLEKTEYEPEQFPGVIYRIEDGPVVLLFSSGAGIITGSQSSEEVLTAANTIRDLI